MVRRVGNLIGHVASVDSTVEVSQVDDGQGSKVRPVRDGVDGVLVAVVQDGVVECPGDGGYRVPCSKALKGHAVALDSIGIHRMTDDGGLSCEKK